MGPKKRPNASSPSLIPTSAQSQMKFRPVLETPRASAKGTKPLPDPITIPEVFTKVLVHGCRKIVFLKPLYRIIAYIALLLFVSLVADYVPLPRTYFSNSQNILNQYFVKWSWAWTLSLVSTFVFLTSSVYCCGKGPEMSKHFARIIIATIIWFTWTSIFQVVEETTGQCIYKANASTKIPSATVYSKGRRDCIKGGGKWTSLDISGHSFILVWCVLFITEECKAIVGWDTIADHIRNEDHRRSTAAGRRASSTIDPLEDDTTTPITHLSQEELDNLKKFYGKYNIWAKIVLVALTLLTILWDVMLIATASYYHIMVEKLLAGLIAIGMWFLTYRGLYKWDTSMSPGLPGVGLFKYSPTASNTFEQKPSNKVIGNPFKSGITSPEEVPTFMGMPLYPPRKPRGKEFGGLGLDDVIGLEGVGTSGPK